MNAIVYLNTGAPVSTSRNIFLSQKHRCYWLFRLLAPSKNPPLSDRFRHHVCHFWQRIGVADGQQTTVFYDFMQDVL